MNKHLLLTASTVLALLLGSAAAYAQAPGLIANERWSCTENVSSGANKTATEYLLENGYLVAQPLGAPRYRVVDNTSFGLIGVDSSADLDIGFVDIYVATVLIDRASGRFSATSATGGGKPEAHAGQCQLVTTKTVGASAKQ